MPVFFHTLTPDTLRDTVKLVMEPLMSVMPIVFVPGVMGSNLKSTVAQPNRSSTAWRVDGNVGVLWGAGFKDPGDRQKNLHPERTALDPGGAVPAQRVGHLASEAQFRARGWGEVAATSYQPFLIWLEENLNGETPKRQALSATLQGIDDAAAWRPHKSFSPLGADESQNAQHWKHPVYAVGYNWLESNAISAKRLRERIEAIIAENNRGMARCSQVIVLTHSMGGLVARACCKLPGMQAKIAGVVHGVMPAIGAAAAYTRCKIGTQDETPSGLIDGKIDDWGASKVLGANGQNVSPVFAQAPGLLQLLPSKQYPRDWLQVRDKDGGLLPGQPDTSDPYASIYKERHKWWGLMREEWLSPPRGEPITWKTFTDNIDTAAEFHADIQDYYHPNTWGFYGQGLNSYDRAVWVLVPATPRYSHGWDTAAPAKDKIMELKHTEVNEDGSNPIGVRMTDWVPDHGRQYDYYLLSLPKLALKGKNRKDIDAELNQKYTGTGDGTVCLASGKAPAGSAQVKQLFALAGIAHEACYRESTDAQHAAVYAIHKITAPLPLAAAATALA
jgi:hypothetical protein